MIRLLILIVVLLAVVLLIGNAQADAPVLCMAEYCQFPQTLTLPGLAVDR